MMLLKRLFDLTVSFIGLIFLAPIFIFIGIAIRLDSPGSVFFTCTRVGQDGRLFRMYKFRTMCDGPNGNGPHITAQDDPRITRIGRILRKTKINELPQLLNVLKGEMSLVGPRPEDPEFVAHYSAEEQQVLSVKPGITSIATLVYYSEEAMLNYATVTSTYLNEIMPSKLRLDQLYIRHRSFLLDLDVLWRTFLAFIPLVRRAAPDVEEVLLGPVQHLIRKHLSWFVLDWLTAFCAVAAAGLIWRASGPLDLGVGLALLVAFILALVFSLVNGATGVQHAAWQYASMGEMWKILLSTGVVTLLLMAGNYFLLPSLLFPPGMWALIGFLALCGFVVTRYRSRLISGVVEQWTLFTGASGKGREKVIVIGGGEAGQMAIWQLKNSRAGRAFHVVGIADDDLWKRGTTIHGVRVLGSCQHIPHLVQEYGVDLLIFAIHNISRIERAAILNICQSTLVRVVVLPDYLSILGRLTDARDADSLGQDQHVAEPLPQGTGGNDRMSPVFPPARVGDNNGFFIETGVVVGWVNDLATLAADGDLGAVQQQLQEIRTSLAGA
jgi:lipopolysaccharide/colanic/teichoic acid biosynthesis glycosyltransferase